MHKIIFFRKTNKTGRLEPICTIFSSRTSVKLYAGRGLFRPKLRCANEFLWRTFYPDASKHISFFANHHQKTTDVRGTCHIEAQIDFF